MDEGGIPEFELVEMESRAERASPGPWFVRHLADSWAGDIVAVSTTADTGAREHWPQFRPGDIVAATLILSPEHYIDHYDGRWEDNARFIAWARRDVPRLVAEVRRLRWLLEQQEHAHAQQAAAIASAQHARDVAEADAYRTKLALEGVIAAEVADGDPSPYQPADDDAGGG